MSFNGILLFADVTFEVKLIVSYHSAVMIHRLRVITARDSFFQIIERHPFGTGPVVLTAKISDQPLFFFGLKLEHPGVTLSKWQVPCRFGWKKLMNDSEIL